MKDASLTVDGGGPFALLSPRLTFCDDPTLAEADLSARAAAGDAVALLWHSRPSLVVPGNYKRFAGLDEVRVAFADAGCPVFLRKSGGGLVPQGPGIINISLAYPMWRTLGEAAEGVYEHLCDLLSDALRDLGVATGWQAVEGSFCDGRYNLACGEGESARKIAGTAQYWQSVANQSAGEPRCHVVLAHAVLLVDVDLAQAHQYANRFEAALGSGRFYQASKTVSVAQMRPDADMHLREETVDALLSAIGRAGVPRQR